MLCSWACELGWKCRGTPLVFLGPATEVFQDWLPKQSVFASVKIPKDNLAASKVEKPTCLASLHNSSWHVSLLFLCLDVLCNFKWIIQKKSSHSGKGQASFFFEDERLVLSHNTVKTCSFLSSPNTKLQQLFEPIFWEINKLEIIYMYVISIYLGSVFDLALNKQLCVNSNISVSTLCSLHTLLFSA